MKCYRKQKGQSRNIGNINWAQKTQTEEKPNKKHRKLKRWATWTPPKKQEVNTGANDKIFLHQMS